MRTRLLIPAAVLLSGCSLRHHPVAPEPARGPALDSLYLLDRARGDSAAARGAPNGLLALFGQRVALLRAGIPTAYGLAAARAALAGTDEAASTITWQPLGGGVSFDLRAAYTYGVTARVTQPGAPIRLERYIAYWERMPAGPWRMSAYAEVGGPSAVDGGVRLAAPIPPPATPPAPKALAAAAATVRATDSLFSDLADRMGTAFAFSNNVDAYGAVFGPSALVVGPQAVQRYFDAQGTGSSLSWRPVYVSVAGSLDLAFTIGDYTATTRGPSGAAIQRFGKYLTVWKRQPNGTWKFVIDGGNTTPAKVE